MAHIPRSMISYRFPPPMPAPLLPAPPSRLPLRPPTPPQQQLPPRTPLVIRRRFPKECLRCHLRSRRRNRPRRPRLTDRPPIWLMLISMTEINDLDFDDRLMMKILRFSTLLLSQIYCCTFLFKAENCLKA